MRRFRVATIPAPDTREVLDDETSHHLLRVIRSRRGDALVVFDGTGLQAPALLVDIFDGRAVIEITGPLAQALPLYARHLVIGLPKGPAMDRAIRMATEAGVTEIHPIVSTRSVARGDRALRWRRIAASAAQQCGRADVPPVHSLGTLVETLPLLPPDIRIGIVGAKPCTPCDGPGAVLIGPEGGWTDNEIRIALEAGAHAVSFGDWTLRSDTAAAVAIAGMSRHNKADA